MSETLFEVSGLEKSYAKKGRSLWRRWRAPATSEDRFYAVRDVSFALARGECLGVVGESGSGKTTLVRMLAGLVPASGGRILFRGAPLELARGGSERARVQMVFQDPTESLNPSFTARATIEEPLRLLAGMRPGAALARRVDELADRVRLPSALLDRYPHQLSGGQKARVGIARALAPEPDVVLLDEPTTALDVSVQARILLLLADLRAQLGTSFVFVTHDLGVVRLMCDRVIVMKDGRIVERGALARVLEAPEHPYTRSLLDALPRIEPGDVELSALSRIAS
jgi:peptide/nickel transport system ATP-binding protein